MAPGDNDPSSRSSKLDLAQRHGDVSSGGPGLIPYYTPLLPTYSTHRYQKGTKCLTVIR